MKLDSNVKRLLRSILRINFEDRVSPTEDSRHSGGSSSDSDAPTNNSQRPCGCCADNDDDNHCKVPINIYYIKLTCANRHHAGHQQNQRFKRVPKRNAKAKTSRYDVRRELRRDMVARRITHDRDEQLRRRQQRRPNNIAYAAIIALSKAARNSM